MQGEVRRKKMMFFSYFVIIKLMIACLIYAERNHELKRERPVVILREKLGSRLLEVEEIKSHFEKGLSLRRYYDTWGTADTSSLNLNKDASWYLRLDSTLPAC